MQVSDVHWRLSRQHLPSKHSRECRPHSLNEQFVFSRIAMRAREREHTPGADDTWCLSLHDSNRMHRGDPTATGGAKMCFRSYVRQIQPGTGGATDLRHEASTGTTHAPGSLVTRRSERSGRGARTRAASHTVPAARRASRTRSPARSTGSHDASFLASASITLRPKCPICRDIQHNEHYQLEGGIRLGGRLQRAPADPVDLLVIERPARRASLAIGLGPSMTISRTFS